MFIPYVEDRLLEVRRAMTLSLTFMRLISEAEPEDLGLSSEDTSLALSTLANILQDGCAALRSLSAVLPAGAMGASAPEVK